MILVVTIRSKTIFLVVVVIAGDSLIGMNSLDLSDGGLLAVSRRYTAW